MPCSDGGVDWGWGDCDEEVGGRDGGGGSSSGSEVVNFKQSNRQKF